MRVALLHYSGPPVIGGVEATIAAHARVMAAYGLEVTIVAGDGDTFHPGVRFVHLPEMGSRHDHVLAVGKALATGASGPPFERLRDRLRGQLQAALAGTDICIAHNILTLHKNLALTAALRQLADGGLRLVGWCHDFAWARPQYQAELHDGYPWDLLRRPWPTARYVTVSATQRDELARLLGLPTDAIRVIPGGVDPAAFLGWRPLTRRLVQRLRLLEGTPLFVLPARITRRKNIELALHIIAALRRAGDDARLVITGPPGPHNPQNAAYLESLQALRRDLGLGDVAHFLYELPNDDGQPLQIDDDVLADLIQSADALLFPSINEGFGIPVLEAGLVRLPVFCSDVPPFHETGGEDVTYLGLDEDPGAIARRIQKRLQNDAAYRLRRRVLTQYTWQRLFQDALWPLLQETCNA